MLYTFKSATYADLIMHETSGKEILALLGKNPQDTRGIITVEQLLGAIDTLHNAVIADKIRLLETDPSKSKNDTQDETPVSLAQRANPFIKLLQSAEKAGEPVVWGV